MKKFWIVLFSILGMICIGIFGVSSSQGNEQKVQQPEPEVSYNVGTVTAESLKIRSGLSTQNESIGLLSKGDTLHIYGKVDDWYIVRTQNNLVGAVYADYVEGSHQEEDENAVLLSQEEQIFLNLINNQRIQNHLPEFELDENLLNIARLKANDLVEKNYFSHDSPTYGSIFDMLKNNQIAYHKASENIARNLNAENAIASLMNSEAHKNNILSQDFTVTGIAVVDSLQYGKIFVEVFVAN